MVAFVSPATAAQDGLAPKAYSEAPSTISTKPLNFDNVPIATATAMPEPPADELSELRFKRANDASRKSDETSSSRVDPSSTVSHSPLPSPFDSSGPSLFQLSGDQSTSCPNFMSSLLGDATFKSCYPVSMLIQTSTGFFNAQKQLVTIVEVLDAACAADVSKCAVFMNQAAQNLTSNGNCKNEFEKNQTQVLQAYRGLRAYSVLYSATCLQDADTSSYCYANAVTNLTTPSDVYLYFMPFGIDLPGSSIPTCSRCTQDVMSIYHSASADRRQFVASTYPDGAQQINTLCGPNFVNTTLPPAESGARITVIPSLYGLTTNALFIVLLFALII